MKSEPFTRAELIELHRALVLIIQEDNSADVNTDKRSVAAKESARKKLRRRLRLPDVCDPEPVQTIDVGEFSRRGVE